MYLIPCLIMLLLSAACSSSSLAPHKANALAVSKEENGYVAVEGQYSNHDYAYSVSVPHEVVGCRDPEPSPNHGFGIALAEKSCGWMDGARNDAYPKSYLYVDASYNSLEWGSPDDAIKAHLGYLKDKGAMNISLEPRTPTQLSKLPAARFVIQYDASGEATVEEMVIAFRKEKDADIVYTIDLATPASRHDIDRKVLAEMQKTWSLQPLP